MLQRLNSNLKGPIPQGIAATHLTGKSTGLTVIEVTATIEETVYGKIEHTKHSDSNTGGGVYEDYANEPLPQNHWDTRAVMAALYAAELVNQDIEATKRELILSTMVSEIGFSEVPEKCLSK
jgi:hypothetical protein